MRLIKQIGGGIRKDRNARRAQRALIIGKALAAAQQDTEVFIPAGAHPLLAADGEAGFDHLGNAPGNDSGISCGIGPVNDIDLAQALIGGAFIPAHDKPLAVPIGYAAQSLREKHLKQIVDPLDHAGCAAEVRIQRQRGRAWGRLRVGLPLLLLAHKDTGVCQTEPVDALLDVAHEEKVVRFGAGQRKVDSVLQGVRVLILVHQHRRVAAADRAAQRCALVALIDEQIERQMLIIRVVQYLFSTFCGKAVVGKGLRYPHKSCHQRRSAAAVSGKFLSRAEQCVPAQAFKLLFCAVAQLGRSGSGLVCVLAALDAARRTPARQNQLKRRQAFVPIALLQMVAEVLDPGGIIKHDGRVGGIGLFVPRCDGCAAVQQRLDALRPGQRDAQQLTAPFGLLRRGLLLPHFGKRSQRCRRVGQCPGKVIEVEDRIPGRAVGTAPVVQVGKGAEVGVLIGCLQRGGQCFLLNAGKVGLLGGRKVRGYIEHGKMLLHKMQAKGIHRADGRALQKQLLAAQVGIAGVGAHLLRKAGRDVSPQLGRRRICEGHDQQRIGIRRVLRVRDKPHHALDQHTGLARAGSRRHQQAAAPCPDGSRLRRGELYLGLFWHGVSPLCRKASP